MPAKIKLNANLSCLAPETLALALSLSLFMVSIPCGPAEARGGFGGGGRGFSGGGGMRDFGDRGFGDRGFGDRGFGDMRSDAFRDFDRGFDHPFDDGGLRDDRPSAFTSPGEMAHSDPMDTGVRNYGEQRSMAGDGGFSNLGRSSALARDARVTPRVSDTSMATQARTVRNSFRNYDAFHNNWWANHPNSWWWRGWDDRWPWRWGSWNDFAGWWGVPLAVYPSYYDYGDNITYDEGGYVDYGGDPICTSGEYYQQSYDLANSGYSDDDEFYSSGPQDAAAAPSGSNQSANGNSNPASKPSNLRNVGDWKPFGVYSLVQGGQSDSSTLFQICSNKKGQIRGNYYNCLTNETEPIVGAVDKKTMRVSWTVGKDKYVVYDTGVANLLKEQSPILVHFGKDRTQQWTLVRLKNSDSKS